MKTNQLTKDAYQIIFKGSKMYFEFSYGGLRTIQKLAMDNNCEIKIKVIKVPVDKEVNA